MNKNQDISRIQTLMLFNQGMHWSMTGVMFPVLSLILLDKGMDLFQLGVLMALYSGTTVLMELPTGGLSDTVGQKRVYLASLGITIAAGVTVLLATGFALLALSFVLLGLARALSSGTMDAYFINRIYEVEPGLDIQPIMAKLSAVLPVSLGVFSLLGGYLPEILARFPGMLPAQWGAYALNICVFMALALLQFVLTSIMIVQKPQHGGLSGILIGFSDFPRVISSSIAFGIKHRTVLLLLVAGFIWGFSVSGLEQFWQPRVTGILGESGSSSVLGYLAFGYFITAGVGSLLSLPLSRVLRKNYPLVIALAKFAMGAFFFILSLQTALPGFAVFYFLTFLANGATSAPESALLNAAVPSERRSTILSFVSLFLQFGGLSGSLLMGLAARGWGIPIAWRIAATLLMASVVLYAGIKKPVAED